MKNSRPYREGPNFSWIGYSFIASLTGQLYKALASPHLMVLTKIQSNSYLCPIHPDVPAIGEGGVSVVEGLLPTPQSSQGRGRQGRVGRARVANCGALLDQWRPRYMWQLGGRARKR